MMTLDEMKLAVCEKLPKPILGIYRYPQMVNWPTEGLQVCHEAEKLLTERQAVWYLQRLSQVRLRQGHGGMIAVLIDKLAFATYEQRLEALCRVWWPDRFQKGQT